MLRVGIVPSQEGPNKEPIGHKFRMGGVTIVVTGYATKEEFLEAAQLNLPEQFHILKQVPDGLFFQCVVAETN